MKSHNQKSVCQFQHKYLQHWYFLKIPNQILIVWLLSSPKVLLLQVTQKFLKKVSKKLKTEFIPVSANASDNIAELRDRIYDELQFIRIYLRPKGGETDYKEPLIIRNGNSVLDICNKLHRKLRKDFRYGLVWGKSVKFGGQRVGLKHILIDEDVLTIIKTKGT